MANPVLSASLLSFRGAAIIAARLNLQRPAQRLETLERGIRAHQFRHLRYLDIPNPAALDTDDVLMRRQVSVVARAVMQHRDFAGLADSAERLESPMDRRERDVRMLLADGGIDLFGPRMLRRGHQRLDNR